MRQATKVRHRDTFISLVNGAVESTEFHYLGAGRGDKAPIRGAAGGIGRGLGPEFLAYGAAYGLDQPGAAGQKRLAGQGPDEPVLQTMPFQHRFGSFFQLFRGNRGRKAKVEPHLDAPGDDVLGSGAALDVGDLEARRREVGIALVPFDGGEFGQRRGQLVDRVARQVG